MYTTIYNSCSCILTFFPNAENRPFFGLLVFASFVPRASVAIEVAVEDESTDFLGGGSGGGTSLLV